MKSLKPFYKIILAIGTFIPFFLTSPPSLLPGDVGNIAQAQSTSGVAIDLLPTTHNYSETVTSTDIETVKTVSPGETFQIAIVAQGVVNLDSYVGKILYDTQKAEFIGGKPEDTSISIHNFLKKDGGILVDVPVVERVDGEIIFGGALRGQDTGHAPEGSGIIALIEFRSKTSGTLALSLHDIIYTDSSLVEYQVYNISNAAVTISGNTSGTTATPTIYGTSTPITPLPSATAFATALPSSLPTTGINGKQLILPFLFLATILFVWQIAKNPAITTPIQQKTQYFLGILQIYREQLLHKEKPLPLPYSPQQHQAPLPAETATAIGITTIVAISFVGIALMVGGGTPEHTGLAEGQSTETSTATATATETSTATATATSTNTATATATTTTTEQIPTETPSPDNSATVHPTISPTATMINTPDPAATHSPTVETSTTPNTTATTTPNTTATPTRTTSSTQGSLNGRLTINGTPAAAITVSALRAYDWNVAGQTTTDSDGKYTLTNLSPGYYKIRYEFPDQTPSTIYYNNKTELSAASLFQLSTAAMHGIDMDAGPILSDATATPTTPANATATTPPTIYPTQTIQRIGDFNHDGKVYFYDLVALADHYLTSEGDTSWDPLFDLNNDKKINLNDIIIFQGYWLDGVEQ